MFASKSLTMHLLRGAIGVTAGSFAVALAPHVWPTLLLVPIALVALRGCPLCWTIGLFETVYARLRGRPTDACTDGRCAVR